MSRIGSSTILRAMLRENFRRQFTTHVGRKLEGKVALITGAARGIGKEAAKKFIDNGAKVVIADIRKHLAQETAEELGPNASFIACDVSKEIEISDAVDFTVSKYGQLDIMYNNAGVLCQTPPSIVDLDLEAFDRIMAINVRGVVAGIKHASRVMIPRQTGSILCTASISAVMGGLAPHTYSISKSSIVGVMKSVAAELCKHGIRTNCISPCGVLTPMAIEEAQKYYPGIEEHMLVELAKKEGVIKGVYGEPIDIANAALYLVSDDAKYVNGQNLVVDGGFTSMKSLDLPSKVE